MSQPKILVPMNLHEFGEYVDKIGCPECFTHANHTSDCKLGEIAQDMESLQK